MTIQQEYLFDLNNPTKFDYLDDNRTETIDGFNYDIEILIKDREIIVLSVLNEDNEPVLSNKQMDEIEASLNEFNEVTERLTKREKRELQYLKNN